MEVTTSPNAAVVAGPTLAEIELLDVHIVTSAGDPPTRVAAVKSIVERLEATTVTETEPVIGSSVVTTLLTAREVESKLNVLLTVTVCVSEVAATARHKDHEDCNLVKSEVEDSQVVATDVVTPTESAAE